MPSKAMILEHLGRAERYVAEGSLRIERPKQLVAELEKDGPDTKEARKLLVQLREIQRLYEEDRDRLVRELARSED